MEIQPMECKMLLSNAGSPFAFIAFNQASTTPAITSAAAHGGARFGACFCDATPPNNDWFISPLFTATSTSLFSLWVKSYNNTYGLERYKIGVSTTGNAPANFTTFLSTSPYEEAPITWTQKTYALSAYNGRQIYVGINCVSNDAFIFMIDDLVLAQQPGGIEETDADRSVIVFPNPSSGVFNLLFNDAAVNHADVAVYNMMGSLVYKTTIGYIGKSSAQVDLSNLEKGMYMISIVSADKKILKKISIF